MLLVEGALLSLVIALLRRGQIRNLDAFPLRYPLLFVGALLCKILVWTVVALNLSAAFRFGSYLYLASFLLALIGLGFNIRWLEFRLAALGLLGNVLCIAANGGRMPVSEFALGNTPSRITDTIRTGINPQNVLLTGDTRLPFLSDVFVLPSGAYSVGDLLLTLAVFLLIQRVMCSKEFAVRRKV